MERSPLLIYDGYDPNEGPPIPLQLPEEAPGSCKFLFPPRRFSSWSSMFWVCVKSSQSGSFRLECYAGPEEVMLWLNPFRSGGYYRIVSNEELGNLVLAIGDKKTDISQAFDRVVRPLDELCSSHVSFEVKLRRISLMCKRISVRKDIKEILEDWEVVPTSSSSSINVEKEAIEVQQAMDTIVELMSAEREGIPLLFQMNYLNPPPKNVLYDCASCGKPAENPCTYRNVLFCQTCIEFEFGCPKRNISPGVIGVPSDQVMEALNALEVYCPFREFGCKLITIRKDITDHVHECPYRQYSCPSKNCTFTSNSLTGVGRHWYLCPYLQEESRDPGVGDFAMLPQKIIEKIWNHLEKKDVQKFKCVSKSFSKLVSEFLEHEFVCSNCHRKHSQMIRYHSGTFNGLSEEDLQTWMGFFRVQTIAGAKALARVPLSSLERSMVFYACFVVGSATGIPLASLASNGASSWLIRSCLRSFFPWLFGSVFAMGATPIIAHRLSPKSLVVGMTRWTCCDQEGSGANGCCSCDL